MGAPLVTSNCERPAGKVGECFYCQRAVGQSHNEHCVLWEKRVRMRATFEYEVSVPHAWIEDGIDHWYNENKAHYAHRIAADLWDCVGDDDRLGDLVVFKYLGGITNQ